MMVMMDKEGGKTFDLPLAPLACEYQPFSSGENSNDMILRTA